MPRSAPDDEHGYLEVKSRRITLESSRMQGVESNVAVTSVPGDDGPSALAIAWLRRTRRAEHEEVWAQLYVDDAFVDVVRALEVDAGGAADEVTFLARFANLAPYLDGRPHVARVSFVSAVSRIVPRSGAGDRNATHGTSEIGHQLTAACEFVAKLPAEARRSAG